MKRFILTICFLVIWAQLQSLDTAGQIIMPYTIQGSFKDGGVPANGSYDISYTLYDTETGTTIVGGNNHISVPVVNGVFSFTEPGYSEFMTPGRTLWIQFGVRPALSQQPFTVLLPRQRMGYVPFSISSLDTLKLGGVLASQYVLTTDARLTNARPPTAGSTSYIQNTSTQQANTNFNISGDGTVGGTLNSGIVNVATQYNLGNSPVLRQPSGTGNLFVGFATGNSNNSTSNTFVGVVTGQFNTGFNNSFFGESSGSNSGGTTNSSFFGFRVGRTATGVANSFFGSSSGSATTTGRFNSFFGNQAGLSNTTGEFNTFVGNQSGFSNVSGIGNTLIGTFTDSNTNLTNATAIGTRAFVGQSNSLVLGAMNGVNGATADTSVGIGTIAPNTNSKLHVNGNVRVTNGGIFVANPNTLVITSPNGACWGITVGNTGALATFPVNPCP